MQYWYQLSNVVMLIFKSEFPNFGNELLKYLLANVGI